MDILIIHISLFGVAIWLAAFPKLLSKAAQVWLTTAVMGLAFITLLGFYPYIRDDGLIERPIEWMPDLYLSLSYYMDGLSLLFALIITGVGALIAFYSGSYFEDRETLTRFNIPLLIFGGAMLGVVLAGNIITLFVMWELTSITSFLLIGFKGDKDEQARSGAMQALIITGGGGLALIVGLILLGVAAGDGSLLTEMRDILAAGNQADHAWYPAITLLIMIGAFTKSAQWPFHFWLPGAMSAPTPASAYLHSATMVKAGIYLLARMYPVLGNADFWTTGLMAIGLLTMLIGAIFSVLQRDLKALLAYSTVSKLGAIVLLIGLPDGIGLKAAFIGIMAHALYKAALFLVVGTVDHTFGTRIVDQLGSVARHLPVTAAIATISAISMAGIPFFFGFVAKETLIAAAMDGPLVWLVTAGVIVGSVFTATAAFILIWDVFFRKAAVHIHHPLSPAIDVGPGILAAGSLTMGFLTAPVIRPFLEAILQKSIKLELFPGFITEFYLSLAAIGLGLAVFAGRQYLAWQVPISGAAIYNRIVQSVEWVGDQLLRSQSGKLRYYLAIILGVMAMVFLGSGLLTDLLNISDFASALSDIEITDTPALELMLLVLVVGSAFGSIVVKRHLLAVLALAVMGYGVAGIFLVRQAVDVALVQFMVETLATVLVITILSRTSQKRRQAVMEKLWVGTQSRRAGFYRDAIIATIAGIFVFLFAATALIERPERDTIAQWHIDNAQEAVGANDIVAAILTDFRGMDTLMEIAVFSIAALGVVTLLSINRGQTTSETYNPISTPFTRAMTVLLLPFALMISIAHILYGTSAPGDGFSAGVIGGLAIALWYVVQGYERAKQRLTWLHPVRFVIIGLGLAIFNAVLPLLWGDGVLAYNSLDTGLDIGIKFSSTLLFEIAIAVTVFGAVSAMLEAIAHPDQVEE